ncbi:site-specific integrase [Latilactobacillus curvatus]|uniref:site-specific integrase n=1 Tax=Latilactobacillus curvatus TaxID=28038 RepID=UPI0020C7940F|nr:site-specific integrase [Latilactobacillus curvatus]MCP8848504.1 site-specific integrase [Latilactobacillus curvatus]MCP8865108.1 site-specific integrase [Latilactobacillus curvatus]MCP8873968.1 site-specific integrase [Latilactobacillus curvatus]MCP8875762.1 site-specific integrase [Latilactobacillus curvatus]MCP8879355.1 site-specific integrase [Latilactobacillus curvatus]
MRGKYLFHEYFEEWMVLYKRGAIKQVTYDKYELTQRQIKNLAPTLLLSDLDRRAYQQLLNDYAATHEHQTTMDFHHQLKSAIYDALDEGYLKKDPTRKAIIKGVVQRRHKMKYLNQGDLRRLFGVLNLEDEVNWDYFILLLAKTGLRFGEALGLTPSDFDFRTQQLTIDKTWNYKHYRGGFQSTKNQSSVRKISLDWQIATQFAHLIKDLPEKEPIFIDRTRRTHNDTANHYLERKCKQAHIPVISVHGLRHTHASILLYAGVSLASVAKRLGHANMTTTQKTYLHIIKKLDSKDNDKIMQCLMTLN